MRLAVMTTDIIELFRNVVRGWRALPPRIGPLEGPFLAEGAVARKALIGALIKKQVDPTIRSTLLNV
jgi:hypothetical protein